MPNPVSITQQVLDAAARASAARQASIDAAKAHYAAITPNPPAGPVPAPAASTGAQPK